MDGIDFAYHAFVSSMNESLMPLDRNQGIFDDRKTIISKSWLSYILSP